MKRILKLMQGNQSKGLFTWKGGDPSTRKILEGSSLKCHLFLCPETTPPPPLAYQVARQERVSWRVGQRDG